MRSSSNSTLVGTSYESDCSSLRELASWPSEVRELLGEMRTIEALDVLCALVREPYRSWRFHELPGATDVDHRPLMEAIAHLVSRGLVRRNDDDGSLQSAVSGARMETMYRLCRLCEDDRANVLGAIAQLSIERVRTSAARTLVGHGRPDTGEP